MPNPVPMSILFLYYRNFGPLLDFLALSICKNFGIMWKLAIRIIKRTMSIAMAYIKMSTAALFSIMIVMVYLEKLAAAFFNMDCHGQKLTAVVL